MKKSFNNKVFENIDNVKQWLWDFVKNKLNPKIVKSITHHDIYCDNFNSHFIT